MNSADADGDGGGVCCCGEDEDRKVDGLVGVSILFVALMR